MLQATAGEKQVFPDAAYTAVGAELLPTIEDVYARAESDRKESRNRLPRV